MPDCESVRTFDLFSGAGGSSWGAQQAGALIVGALDLDPIAGLTYQDNFPGAQFYCNRAEFADPCAIAEEVGQIDLLLASPECTNHTPAKGKGPRSESSRETAFQVLTYAEALQPRWIVIENVTHMRPWSRYTQLIEQLRLNYRVSEVRLNAADFGVPQARTRLFILCDREADPPVEIQPPRWVAKRCALDVINLNACYAESPLMTPRRAKATLARAERAFQSLGQEEPFLLVYYGTDKSGVGGWQRLGVPLRTVTTLDRFALVRRQGDEHVMRMLQPPELRAAMGFSRRFKLKHGVRRDKIRLLGNAVCPPVMRQIVRSLTAGRRCSHPGHRHGPS